MYKKEPVTDFCVHPVNGGRDPGNVEYVPILQVLRQRSLTLDETGCVWTCVVETSEDGAAVIPVGFLHSSGSSRAHVHQSTQDSACEGSWRHWRRLPPRPDESAVRLT